MTGYEKLVCNKFTRNLLSTVLNSLLNTTADVFSLGQRIEKQANLILEQDVSHDVELTCNNVIHNMSLVYKYCEDMDAAAVTGQLEKVLQLNKSTSDLIGNGIDSMTRVCNKLGIKSILN